MITPRHAPAVCVAVALALVPTLIHSYAGALVDDGLTTRAIPESLAGFTSSPSGRNREWGRRRFESDDWVERRYVSGDDAVVLTVIRSYDPKSLYHHPELAVAYGASFLERDSVQLSSHGAIPAQLLRSKRDGGPTALYVLHYGEGFVADPFVFQMQTALEMLFSGRRPMTLFFAHDLSAPQTTDVETLPSAVLLREAVEAFTSGNHAAR